MTLDASPLEHEPMRMIPAAISGSKWKILVSANPTSGITEKWQTMPTSTPRGDLATPVKSFKLICVPMPNITVWTTMRMSHLLRRSKSPHFKKAAG